LRQTTVKLDRAVNEIGTLKSDYAELKRDCEEKMSRLEAMILGRVQGEVNTPAVNDTVGVIAQDANGTANTVPTPREAVQSDPPCQHAAAKLATLKEAMPRIRAAVQDIVAS